MAADVVAGMNEPRLAGTNHVGKVHSLVEGLVGVMGLLAQGVDYQGVATLNIGYFLFGNGLHIGDIH